MVLNEEFEHLHRVAAIDVKRAVEEFDDFRAVLDQVQDIRLNPFDIVIAYADLDA
ncbi:hypothetical protein D3C76_1496530 [compost metagenome]